jgi:alpha-galactosidase
MCMAPGRSSVRKAMGAIALLLAFVASSRYSLTQPAPLAQASLAPTPPMGWASWNHFFCDYDDRTIRAQADALVSSGMREMGYRYVLIQECIAPARAADGTLIVDAARFSHGMKDLVDYIHARGLKAGIYTDIGAHTCFPKPLYEGSYQHEKQDARTFAAWGMDMVEMDFCNHPDGVTGRAIYERMAAALQATGRPMLFYLCSWGEEAPWTWAQGKAQFWRTTGDISLVKNHAEWKDVLRNFELNAAHSVFSAPNGWNDPDMLEIGNEGLTLMEAQSQFSMWAVSAAPLLAGSDLTAMSDSVRGIYTNQEVIAVDQDPLGAGAVKIAGSDHAVEVWTKTLGAVGSGRYAVLLLNLSEAPAIAKVQWSDLGLNGKADVRDLWAHRDLGNFRDGYRAEIPAHGSVLLNVSGEFSWKKGATYEAESPGNLREGNASLLACVECSEGYAVSLRGGATGLNGGSVTLTNVVVPQTDRYVLSIFFAGAHAGTQVEVRVNNDSPSTVELKAGGEGATRIPVALRRGRNSIAFHLVGEGSVGLDRFVLSR